MVSKDLSEDLKRLIDLFHIRDNKAELKILFEANPRLNTNSINFNTLDA